VDKSSAALELKQKAFTIAENGKAEEALKLVLDYPASTAAEKRILGHSLAEIHILIGNTRQALEILLQTQKNHGEHVSLLGEIAMCYYILSDFRNWKFAFEDMKRAYATHKDILTFDRRIMAEFTLAKFIEEDGDVATAAARYLRIMKEMNERHDSKRFFRAIAQALRVLATFRMSSQLSDVYLQMIGINEKQIGLNSYIDVQQSLLLAELALVGPQSASSRLMEILQNKDICMTDKQTLYFDFLEEHLLRGFELSQEVKSFSSGFTDLNDFEREIHRLIFSDQSQIDIGYLTTLSRKMPLACYLRTLGAFLAKAHTPSLQAELRSQFKLVISTLNPESQQLWISRYKNLFLAADEIEILYDSGNKTLQFGGKSADLSRRSGFQGLLELFSSASSLETETAIQKLWNVEFDPTYYKSLRMTVHRLNEVLFELSGIPKAIEINKQKLEIKGKIIFKIV